MPYSNERNWTERYLHAAPAFECTQYGASVRAGGLSSKNASGPSATVDNRNKKRKPGRANHIVRDRSCLPDAERDELHLKIYNHLSWLRSKLA